MPPSTNRMQLRDPISWDPERRLIDIGGVNLPGHPISGYLLAFLRPDGVAARWDTVAPPPMPLNDLGFDLEGRLWVQRSVAPAAPCEADLYARDGKLIATVTWPANIRFFGWAVRGRTGIGLQVDEDGVQRVVRVQFAGS